METHGDELLSAIAPLGLAVAAGTAVVVDVDPLGPPYPGERTVAELVEEGPRRSELVPERSGVVAIRSGGASLDQAMRLVGMLAEGWPAVVVRVGEEPVAYPTIPVMPLWPGWLAPAGSGAAVWQSVAGSGDPPGPGPVLPPPGRGVMTSLLAGRRPPPSRWVRAWRRVWELPWP